MAQEPIKPHLAPTDLTPSAGVIRRNNEQLDNKREIVFWDMHNPKSVINLLSEKVKEHALAVSPELLATGLHEIRKKLEPTYVDEQLRIAFWDEYFLTVDNNQNKMRLVAVHSRVCSREYFYQVCENPLRMAYMLHPPEDYILQMKGLLNMGILRFEEILKLPLESANGQINTKLIGEIVKIVTIIDNRVKGAVTQRIQIDGTQKNLHVHAHQNAPPPGYEPPKTIQDVSSELKNIEKEIKLLQNPTSPVQLFDEHPEEITEDERDTAIETTAVRT